MRPQILLWAQPATLVVAALVCAAPPAVAQQPADDANVVFDPGLFGALEYRMVGPYRGGRATAVTGVPGRPHTFLMGSTGGGVWKTADGGQHWTNISDGFFGGSVGAIAVAPADRNVIYVGTGSACIRGNTSTGRGMYKSQDGGRTWSFAGLPEAGQIGRVVTHPRNADLVYAAALGHPFGPNPDRGVYRSSDGGATWEQVLFVSDSTGAVDLALNPHNPREIYAAMWRAERKPWTLISGAEEGGLYKSSDGGDTWRKLGGGLPEGVVGKVGVTVSPANPDRVWALVEAEPAGGVYRSDDAGATWTRVNDENALRQRAWYYTHIVADPRDEHTVYALNTGLYRSIDGGKTFEQIDVPHGDVHDLWIDPEDPATMVVGDDGGAQVTVSAGETWSSYFNQPTAELYDVVTDNGFPYRLYGAQQDNTTISVPAWSSSNTLYPKQHWLSVGGCETGPIALHPDRPDVVFAGCYGGVIDRFDRPADQIRNLVLYPQLQLGEAAENLRYRFQWNAPIAVSPHDPNLVYHGSQFVHRSSDGGFSWETISPDLTTDTPVHQAYSGGPINHDITGVEIYNTVYAIVPSPHDPLVVWAGTDDGRVHVTRDGGDTWQDVTPGELPELGTVNRIEVSPHAPGRAFLAVHRYRLDDFAPYVFVTADHGERWALLTDGANGIPGDHPVRVVREDPVREGLLYAGTEFGAFVSFNGGANWQSLQLNLPVTPVTGMEIRQDDLVLATQGRSFWILDDLTPLRQLDDDVAIAGAHLFAPRVAYRVNSAGGGDGLSELPVDPLPGNALIHYHLARAPDSIVTLEIVDADDRTVWTRTSDSAAAAGEETDPLPGTAGMHRMVWDLTYPGPDPVESAVIWGYRGGVKAPPGRYRVRLAVNGQIHEQPLRVAKDPRLETVTQEDFDEQFRLAMAIRDTLNLVYAAIGQATAVRDQVEGALDRGVDAGVDAEVRPLADSIAVELTAVEEALIQTKNRSGQDPIRFASMLDNQYVALYEYVTGVDGYRFGGPEGRPTSGAYALFGDLNAEWTAVRRRLRRVLDEDVSRLNDLLRRLGVDAVVVPGRRDRPIS